MRSGEVCDDEIAVLNERVQESLNLGAREQVVLAREAHDRGAIPQLLDSDIPKRRDTHPFSRNR